MLNKKFNNSGKYDGVLIEQTGHKIPRREAMSSNINSFNIHCNGNLYEITILASQPLYSSGDRRGFELAENGFYHSKFSIHEIRMHNGRVGNGFVDHIENLIEEAIERKKLEDSEHF